MDSYLPPNSSAVSIDDDDQSCIANLLADNAVRYEGHFVVSSGAFKCTSKTHLDDDTFTIENVIGSLQFLRTLRSFTVMILSPA